LHLIRFRTYRGEAGHKNHLETASLFRLPKNVFLCFSNIRRMRKLKITELNRLTADERDSEQYVRDLLDIPYQMGVLCIIGFGHKDQERKPFDESHLLWEKVHIGKFALPGTSEEATQA